MFVIIVLTNNYLCELFLSRVVIVKIKLLFLLQSKNPLPIEKPVQFLFIINKLYYY